jgi:hypothetical protein
LREGRDCGAVCVRARRICARPGLNSIQFRWGLASGKGVSAGRTAKIPSLRSLLGIKVDSRSAL